MKRNYTKYLLDQNKLLSVLLAIFHHYDNAKNIARLTYLKGGESYKDEKLYKETKDFVSPVVYDLLDAMDAVPAIYTNEGYIHYSKSAVNTTSDVSAYDDLSHILAITLHYALKVYGEDYICGLSKEQLSLLKDRRLEVTDFDEIIYTAEEIGIFQSIIGQSIPTGRTENRRKRSKSSAKKIKETNVKDSNFPVEDF